MVFGFNNFILEENKNVYGTIVFPSKSHWAVWVAKARFHDRQGPNFGLLTFNTPFENPERWMGQNTFPILLLNDDNMIGEH